MSTLIGGRDLEASSANLAPSSDLDDPAMHELSLSTETRLRIEASTVAPTERWLPIPHSGIVRPALILIAGESAEFIDAISVRAGCQVSLRYGAAHDALSADGAELLLELRDETAGTTLLGRFPVLPGAAGMAPRIATLDLTPFAGSTWRLRLRCLPGPEHDPTADWIAVYDLAIGSEERLPVLRARAFRKERTENEIAHFSTVYQHAMYTSSVNDSAETQPSVDCELLANVIRDGRGQGPSQHAAIETFPAPGEVPDPKPQNAFDYAHRLLGSALKSRSPNFHKRLVELCARVEATHGRSARVLSLCSGAARFEAQFAAGVGNRAEWTLLDISEGLLQDASRNFPANVRPRLIVADLNDVADFGDRFDLVMCVSGLHHIVELERVVGFVQDVLADAGEFWSIGEAIGRTGNRLWETDYAVANDFFHALPERLRRNRLTMNVDRNLPNSDCSDATFEGIRSDDIEPLLSHRLEPVHLYRRNCFLWRVVDLAYADNYDLSSAEDVGWIQAAVRAEIAHYFSGGQPTELHGVFRKRIL